MTGPWFSMRPFRRFAAVLTLSALPLSASFCAASFAGDCPYPSDFIYPLPQEACFTRLQELPTDFYLTGDEILTGDEESAVAVRSLRDLLERAMLLNETAQGDPDAMEVRLVFKDFQNAGPETFRQEAYELTVSENAGAVKLEIAAESPAGFYYAAQTLRQIVKKGDARWSAPLGRAFDFPRFAVRGVLEGGYSVWDFEQRLDLIRDIGPLKMNYFMYAPKEGHFFRRQWRKPYPEAVLDEHREYIRVCRESFVEFAFALSPAISIEYGSEEEFETLVARYKQMADLGVSHFAIFFDDVLPVLAAPRDRRRFANVAEAQVYVTNKLYERLKKDDPAVKLAFVPNQYWGFRPSVYLNTVAKNLHPEVQIGWTGLEIVSQTIETRDALDFAKAWGRPPAIGDNWSPFGPYSGRSPDLWTAADNFINNPYAFADAYEAQLSKIIDTTLADYTWNPEAYQPERSMRMGSRWLAGGDPGAGETLLRVIEHGGGRRGLPYTPQLSILTDEGETAADPVVFINIMTKLQRDLEKSADPATRLAGSGINARLFKQLHGHMKAADDRFRQARQALDVYFSREGTKESRSELLAELRRLGF